MNTKNFDAETLRNAAEKIGKLHGSRADKIAGLYREKTSVQNELDSLECQVEELQKHSAGASVDDIAKSIDQQTELKTRIDAGKEKLRLLDAQINYSRNEENYLEFDEYDSTVSEIRSGYEEIKRVELLKAQQLADEMTSCGERIVDAQKAAQNALDEAFDLYHGYTRFNTKTERKCVGTEEYETKDDTTGETHKRKRGIYENIEIENNSRVRPTVGQSTDISAIRETALRFDTRGDRAWWYIGK